MLFSLNGGVGQHSSSPFTERLLDKVHLLPHSRPKHQHLLLQIHNALKTHDTPTHRTFAQQTKHHCPSADLQHFVLWTNRGTQRFTLRDVKVLLPSENSGPLQSETDKNTSCIPVNIDDRLIIIKVWQHPESYIFSPLFAVSFAGWNLDFWKEKKKQSGLGGAEPAPAWTCAHSAGRGVRPLCDIRKSWSIHCEGWRREVLLIWGDGWQGRDTDDSWKTIR